MKPTPIVIALLGATVLPAFAQNRDAAAPMDFQGRYIVSISDADMLASAYVNGQLGPREGTDALSVINLDGDPRDWAAVEVPASNSVAGPPAAVELSPDGRWAFVIETFTPRPEGDAPHAFADLRVGNTLTVIDLADPAAPVVAQTIEIPMRPDAVRMNAAGTILAVSFNPANGAGGETPLALFRFDAGTLSAITTPVIPDWPLDSGRLIDIDWHPTEDVVAMIDGNNNTVRFARITADLAVEPFGNVVDIERAPYRVEFTPDGNHVVINALYWGPDIAGTWIEAPRGTVMTVRMNAEGEGAEARHTYVSRVITGVSPEGLAVSPDGRWVATTNLERSYLPYDDPRVTYFSSITLARLDQATGQLSEVGTFNYDGILPEAAVFDNSGNFLAVANYDHFDDRIAGGSIDFWRIQADPLDLSNVQLVKTQESVPVTRGAHSMVIAR
ncbi:beta-propeller fold lactonase family protein [Tabrizicola sp.]|uniref:beta-propeller fold lactonase family protein n=1 Tax=Tabrizicola sp. TaxID=2005166 RepID=UPI003F3B45EB